MEKVANKIDIAEMRTYVNENTEENSVCIWTACIKKKEKKYYVYEFRNRDKKLFKIY